MSKSPRNFSAAFVMSCLLLAGCPDQPSGQDGGTDQGPPPADLSCFTNPQTHVELLNACTTAQSVDKQPVLPLLRSDGTLPPLP